MIKDEATLKRDTKGNYIIVSADRIRGDVDTLTLGSGILNTELNGSLDNQHLHSEISAYFSANDSIQTLQCSRLNSFN